MGIRIANWVVRRSAKIVLACAHTCVGIPLPQSPFEDQAGGCAMNKQTFAAVGDASFHRSDPMATTNDSANSLDPPVSGVIGGCNR